MDTQVVIKDAATKTFGEVIKDARTQRGLSQVAVATRADISGPQLCKIERGSRHANLKTAARLLDSVGLDNAWLMRSVVEQSAAHSGLTLDEFQAILINGLPA